jgi:hypothetical protein
VARTLSQWLEELEKHTDKSGDCWLWTGKRNENGYGVVKSQHLAHRLAWQIANNGQYPDRHVCHRCDNRRCVNPKHLYLGTPRMNTADQIRRGRLVLPTKNSHRTVLAIQRRQVRRDEWAYWNDVAPEDIAQFQRFGDF